MADGPPPIRPIFVLGAPRSGTTVLGSYVASAPAVCDLGEYAGFFFAHHIAEREYRRVPSPYKDRYMAELRDHAREFPGRIARASGCGAFCDSTPWNLLVAAELVQRLPDALFVLTVRDIAGLSQSLARSHAAGYEWAGATIAERAELWRDFYAHVEALDPARTILVDYEHLCADPTPALAELDRSLVARGIAGPRDRGQFCESHANPEGSARPTLGTYIAGGGVALSPIASSDPAAWSPEAEYTARSIVEGAASALARFRERLAARPGGAVRSIVA